MAIKPILYFWDNCNYGLGHIAVEFREVNPSTDDLLFIDYFPRQFNSSYYLSWAQNNLLVCDKAKFGDDYKKIELPIIEQTYDKFILKLEQTGYHLDTLVRQRLKNFIRNRPDESIGVYSNKDKECLVDYKKSYNAVTNNCAHAVMSALQTAGCDIDYTEGEIGMRPFTAMSRLHDYCKRHFEQSLESIMLSPQSNHKKLKQVLQQTLTYAKIDPNSLKTDNSMFIAIDSDLNSATEDATSIEEYLYGYAKLINGLDSKYYKNSLTNVIKSCSEQQQNFFAMCQALVRMELAAQPMLCDPEYTQEQHQFMINFLFQMKQQSINCFIKDELPLAQFKENLQEMVVEGKAKFDGDWTWTQLFNNLLCFVLGLGVGYVAAVGVNYYKHQRFLLFGNKQFINDAEDLLAEVNYRQTQSIV